MHQVPPPVCQAHAIAGRFGSLHSRSGFGENAGGAADSAPRSSLTPRKFQELLDAIRPLIVQSSDHGAWKARRHLNPERTGRSDLAHMVLRPYVKILGSSGAGPLQFRLRCAHDGVIG